ncbi:hypothetical protein FB45DRAFT_888044 [Roridomyces roridus]|uniref:Uncharacterized protein n=1 Tax=Roridomyces roridus TaxID=1738132 RepID=A0AAD7CJH9_9AGAR|nr:hypothetical protein FB45DRAFT_888044 [Roridomyces roridus]
MPSSQVSLALFVPLIAKHDKVDDVSAFLGAGYDLVQVGLVSNTLTIYAILDAFSAESGRGAHPSGKVAEALVANAGTLLAAGPDIMSNNILAKKVVEGAKVSVGLRVLLTAKPEKVDEVRVPHRSEPGTLAWYAIEFPGTNKFGIVDFFADETGRNAHIGGKVAEVLFANADAMLVMISPPDLTKVDVVAPSVRV